MINRRYENFKLGNYDTTQVFLKCDLCESETNIVEWFIRVIPDKQTTYECPVCKQEHTEFKQQ